MQAIMKLMIVIKSAMFIGIPPSYRVRGEIPCEGEQPPPFDDTHRHFNITLEAGKACNRVIEAFSFFTGR